MIVEKDGTVLGEHDGIDRFTVGQRKGLGFAAGRKRFVLEIVPETNTVVVGDAEDLLATGLVASRVNWLADVPHGPLRVRRQDPLSPCRRPRDCPGRLQMAARSFTSANRNPPSRRARRSTFYAGTASWRRLDENLSRQITENENLLLSSSLCICLILCRRE